MRRYLRRLRVEDRTVDDLTNAEVVQLLRLLEACPDAITFVESSGLGGRQLYLAWSYCSRMPVLDYGWLSSKLHVWPWQDHRWNPEFIQRLVETAHRRLASD